MANRYAAAFRDVIAAGRSKGLSYLEPGSLRGLAGVAMHRDVEQPGMLCHYRSIAHHSKPDRFDRHDFIVIPENRAPTHEELFTIALATTSYRSGNSMTKPSGDLVDRLRAKLTYPRHFARTVQLLAPAGVGVPDREHANYQRFVTDVVMSHLPYPREEAPGLRAMRMKLVFVDALPIPPADPRLSDYEALAGLAETLHTRSA